MSTGATGRLLSISAATLLLLTPTAGAAADKRFTVAVGGGMALLPIEWSAVTAWEAWAEQAEIEARHEASSGPMFGGALGYRFSRNFGIELAVSSASRDATAALNASLPHPLLLDRPRTLEHDLSGLAYQELALHLDLEWRTVKGPVELALLAGPTMARAEADLAQQIEVTEAYPYDEISFRSVETASVRSDFAPGWNVGGSLAWLVAKSVDIGVAARYSQASVDLEPVEGETATLDVGGLQVMARLRLRF